MEVCVLINRAALWVFPVFAVFTASLLEPIYVFVVCLRCLFASKVLLVLTALSFPTLISQVQKRKRTAAEPKRSL